MATGRPDIITASGHLGPSHGAGGALVPLDVDHAHSLVMHVSVAYRCRDGHVAVDSISRDYLPLVVTDREVVARFNTVTRGSI